MYLLFGISLFGRSFTELLKYFHHTTNCLMVDRYGPQLGKNFHIGGDGRLLVLSDICGIILGMLLCGGVASHWYQNDRVSKGPRWRKRRQRPCFNDRASMIMRICWLLYLSLLIFILSKCRVRPCLFHMKATIHFESFAIRTFWLMKRTSRNVMWLWLGRPNCTK